MTREIVMSPTFSRELFGLSPEDQAGVNDKIRLLIEDPLADGGSKKRLAGKDFKDVFRIRFGDRRIFYTFGETWVKLLTIRQRNEKTYRDPIEAEGPTEIEDSGEIDLDALERAEDPKVFRFSGQTAPVSRPLPRPLTPEWLSEVDVPAQYFSRLISCKTEDDLLEVVVPDSIISRLVDLLFPPSLATVLTQPGLVVKTIEDLVRYREGSLMALLLKLDDEQRALTDWALKGPTMIKGGAGTGKSTVALYRVKAMLEAPRANGRETALFTTYTQALTRASKQLLDQLLDDSQRSRVCVATCDKIAHEIVSAQRTVGKIPPQNRLRKTLRELRKTHEPGGANAFEKAMRKRWLSALSDNYILEEFEWIIDGRGLKSLEEYQAASRPGRGCALKEGARAALWDLRSEFMAELKRRGLELWPELRSEALEHVKTGAWSKRFDIVVVDEAQDLTPVALALMAELAASPAGLFFAADSKQSLYSRNYNWSSANEKLQFTGRSRNLKRNYRSTAEIDAAAFEVLTAEQGEELERSLSLRSGPFPMLLKGVDPGEEGSWAARFIKQMAQHLRVKSSAAAVLVPTKEIGERITIDLENAGLPAHYYSSDKIDLSGDQVKVMTQHAAKGLEFPIVVLCGFDSGTWPNRADFADQAVYEERLRNARRLLYVGMSRAMSGLLVIVQKSCEHEALQNLSSERWAIEEVK